MSVTSGWELGSAILLGRLIFLFGVGGMFILGLYLEI